MTPRDWMETAWHGGLLLLVARPVLGFLLRHPWARLAFAVAIVVALVYHVAVVQACYHHRQLCYWG